MDAVTAIQTQAAPPQAPLTEGTSRAIRPEQQTGPRYVFTVANMIAPLVLLDNPDWRIGGVIRDVGTLKWCNGYIPRCEIREMRMFMDSDSPSMIHPDKRSGKVGAYYHTEKDPQTGELKEVIKGTDGLLRTEIYPIWEVGTLTSAKDGVVEMKCVKNAEQRAYAQAFLFPDWEKIVAGDFPLPEKTSQLKAHFMRRLAEAQKVTDSGLRSFYVQVAQTAIRACEAFEGFGKSFTQWMNGRIKQAEVKGADFNTGAEYDLVCSQLGIQRRDYLQQEQADKMDRVADLMEKQTEMQNRLLEFQLDQAQGRTTTPPATEPPAPAAGDVAPVETAAPFEPEPPPVDNQPPVEEAPKCMATTGKGTQCKNDALEDGFCKLETHNAEAEAAKLDAENAEAENNTAS